MTEYIDKKNNSISIYFFIGLSMIFASFLEIFISDILSFYVSLPISLMVLIYWNMALPRSVGLLWALLAGFTLDIAQEIYLGSHVFLFLMVSYLTQRYFHRLRALYTIQQSIFVAFLVLLYQITLLIFFTELNINIFYELFIVTIVSALLWPIIFGLLRFLRIKFTYNK